MVKKSFSLNVDGRIYQIRVLRPGVLSIDGQIVNVEMTDNGVSVEGEYGKLEGVEEGSESLVPLGAGCYGRGKLLEKGRVMVEVGAGIMAGKTLAEAAAIVKERKAEAERVGGKLQLEIQKVTDYMNKAAAEMQGMNEAQAPERGK